MKCEYLNPKTNKFCRRKSTRKINFCTGYSVGYCQEHYLYIMFGKDTYTGKGGHHG
jgi:hypothetical protein